MRVDWCVSSWFRIKNTHSLTRTVAVGVVGGEGACVTTLLEMPFGAQR